MYKVKKFYDSAWKVFHAGHHTISIPSSFGLPFFASDLQHRASFISICILSLHSILHLPWPLTLCHYFAFFLSFPFWCSKLQSELLVYKLLYLLPYCSLIIDKKHFSSSISKVFPPHPNFVLTLSCLYVYLFLLLVISPSFHTFTSF